MKHLYTYLPVNNTAETEGILSTRLAPAGWEKYIERSGKHTKKEVLEWLDQLSPGFKRSNAVSVFTAPIPDTAHPDMKAFRDAKELYAIPEYKELVRLGVAKALRRIRTGNRRGTDPTSYPQYRKIDWENIEPGKFLFSNVPHYLVELNKGKVPKEYVEKRAAAIPKSLRLVIPGLAKKWKVSPESLRGGFTAQQTRYIHHVLSVAHNGKIPGWWRERSADVVEQLSGLTKGRALRPDSFDYVKPWTFDKLMRKDPQLKRVMHKLPFDKYQQGYRFPRTVQNYSGQPLSGLDKLSLYKGVQDSYKSLLGLPIGPTWTSPNPDTALQYATEHSGQRFLRINRVPKSLIDWISRGTTDHVKGAYGTSIDQIASTTGRNSRITPGRYRAKDFETVLSPADYDKLLTAGGTPRVYQLLSGNTAQTARVAPLWRNNAHGQYPLKMK